MTDAANTEGSKRSPDAPVHTTPKREGLGFAPGVVALLVAGGLLLALIAQNGTETRLDLLWFHLKLPLSVLVLGSALIAVVLDEAVGLIWRHRRRRLLDLKDRSQRAKRDGG